MKQFLFSPTKQFQYASGKLLAGGKIYVYFKDTEDLAPLYNVDDSYQSNPIILDANGRASVKADDTYEYRLEVFSMEDVLQFTCNAFYAGDGGGSGGEFIVRHDETLSGNGTSQSLLGVVTIPLAVDDTMTAYESTIEDTKTLVLGVNGDWFNNTFSGALSSKVDWETFSACCSAVKGGLDNKLDVSAYDLSNYYTKNETTYLLSNYVTTPTFNDSISILQNSKQDKLTFGYDSQSAISSINNSAIGGQGASYPASAEDAVQYVVNNSATINEVNNTYETNSGSYLTAHQPISSNEWNSNYNTVNSNSAKWNNISAYQNNSANYLTTGDANTISSMFSAAIDYVSANVGQSISGDYELSAGYGITLTDFSADRITRIDVTGGGGILPERFVVSADGQAYKMNITTASNEFEDLVVPGYSSLFQLWNMQINDNQSPYNTEYTIYPDTPWSGGSYRISILSGYDMTNYSATTALTSNKLKLSDYMSSADFESYLEDCWLVVQPLNISQTPINSGISLHYEISSLNPYALSSDVPTGTKNNSYSAISVAEELNGSWSATLPRIKEEKFLQIDPPRIITIINNFDAARVSSYSWSADPCSATCEGNFDRDYLIPQGTFYTFMISKDKSTQISTYYSYYPVMSGSCSSINNFGGGVTFPMSQTEQGMTYSVDVQPSAIFITTAAGPAGGTTKFTTKGVQYQAYPGTDVSASWYNLIKGANVSSFKMTTAQASYEFTSDEIRHLSQINVATPYTYSGPSTYSVTLGTKTFNNLDSGCYYDFMRAEVEGNESWVMGATGTYSLS